MEIPDLAETLSLSESVLNKSLFLFHVGVAYEDQPQCLLTDYLKLFNSICDQQATIRQLLGEDMFKEKGDENLDKIPDVFNRLTGVYYRQWRL